MASAARAQQTQATPGMQITQLDNGWVIAPHMMFTRINDRSTALLGAYGGYDIDHTLFIGAAAYWNTNRDHFFETQYGGGVVRWTFRGQQPIAVSAGSLIGFGSGTISRSYASLFGTPPPIPTPRHGYTIPITGSTQVGVHDDFFIAEPQVNLLVRVVPWMRLDVGASYRAVTSADLIEHQIRGASGSIALRFGNF
jgi:hypothetical protein